MSFRLYGVRKVLSRKNLHYWHHDNSHNIFSGCLLENIRVRKDDTSFFLQSQKKYIFLRVNDKDNFNKVSKKNKKDYSYRLSRYKTLKIKLEIN